MRGTARRKNATLIKIFQKVSKNAFFCLFFFQKMYLGGVAVLGGSPPESNAGVSDDVGEELTLARDRHF